ncbi:hypothetical protein G6L37_03390 [Agrobacterium rubi]|nr:hypothetical protein [Agrobacterium rubi]NTF24415.1 hypothetical protein [Agrobacterium rubi]
MFLKRLSVALIAVLAAGSVTAQDASQGLPFAHVENDAPQTMEIWKGFDDEYLARKDTDLNVFTAKIKTPEGDELLISQFNTSFVCGDFECPLRIVRNGKIVFDNSVCRYTEKYSLNRSMNTLFACDTAVPTVEIPVE